MAGKVYPGQRPPDWQPPEGAPKTGGFRWWHAVLLVLGLGYVGSLVSPPPKVGESPQAKSAIAGAPIPAQRKVSSIDLARAYDANEVSAQQFASAGPLQVTGTVKAIELDFADNPVVQLEGKDDYSNVSVYFEDSARDVASALSKGSQLTVVCSNISEVISYPQLKDCVLPTAK